MSNTLPPVSHETLRDDPRLMPLMAWINSAGARDLPQHEMLQGYCEHLIKCDVPLMRAHITINALHPVYGSLGANWMRKQGSQRHEYGHATEAPVDWLQSPFYYMLDNGIPEMRERIDNTNEASRFPVINTMKALGATDYFAAAVGFGHLADEMPISPLTRREGALMSWMSDAPGGFPDRDLALIRSSFSSLCLAFRATSNRQTAVDLLEVYLGKDAGKRVLSGEIQRGSTQWIDAVICYFDLEGFTDMSQRLVGEDLIALLNDYFELVVARIEEQGGNVLKFMGDGLLAIFDRDVLGDAPDRALASLRDLRADITGLNVARTAQGTPTMDYTVALHAGQVLYGNIGADERLDFTVIGPEVNLGARIGGMHKALGQSVIISQAVAKDVTQEGFELISLGRYMLRGVQTPQELFTMHPAETDADGA